MSSITLLQNIIIFFLRLNPAWFFVYPAGIFIIASAILFFVSRALNCDFGKFLSQIALFNFFAISAACIVNLFKLF